MPDTVSEAFRAMFCQMYGVTRPAVTLSRIIHWRAVVADVDLQDRAFNQTAAFVPAGFFYEMSIPPPDEDQLARARHAAAHAGADWVLYPQIRTVESSDALARAGFLSVPWFMEAQFRMCSTVDEDLRRQLGNARYRDLRRLVRRAEEEYAYQVLDGDEVARAPAALAAFDRLHAMNLAKYGHRYNHLSSAALHIVLDSPLRQRMRLFLCRPRPGGEPVQAVLTFLDAGGQKLTILAQGIDADAVPARHNLYRVSFYQIYRWGESRRVRVFSLGRGNEVKKLAVGANTFHLLANHIGRVSSADPAALTVLRDRLERLFANVIDDLSLGAGDRVSIVR